MTFSLLKLTAAAVALGAAIDVKASDWELGLGLPYYAFDTDAAVEDKTGVNLNIGYRFDKPFGVELSASQVSTEAEAIDLDIDVNDIRLDGLWYLHNEGKVLPYAAGGVGILQYDGIDLSDENTANVGLGVKTHVSERFRVRLDGRWLHNLDSHQNHSILTLGLGYVFGAAKPAPAAPVILDNDKDGVPDSSDACMTTPAGVNVDARGCAIDTDKDRVADYLDQCPDTDRKLKVDDKGCPIALSEEVSIDLNVQFASGSDVVTAEYFPEIRGVARFMEQYQGSQVVIEGHTDTSGSAAFNKKLSQKRANSVAALLTEQYGIAASRVKAIGYGEEQPIVEEKTAADKATNRRVVAKVSATKKSLEAK